MYSQLELQVEVRTTLESLLPCHVIQLLKVVRA